MNRSAELRTMLASVGIVLDEPVVKVEQQPSTWERDAAKELAEREQIREALIVAGAPDRDLNWLVESCPGIAYAMEYTPPLITQPDNS